MSSAEIPALFNNQTAEGVTYLDLVYNATYGEGEGITNTLYVPRLQTPHSQTNS